MLNYKQRFIKFMVENEVLLFGDFTLKSGRKAPYFINAASTARARRSRSSANTMRSAFWSTAFR